MTACQFPFCFLSFMSKEPVAPNPQCQKRAWDSWCCKLLTKEDCLTFLQEKWTQTCHESAEPSSHWRILLKMIFFLAKCHYRSHGEDEQCVKVTEMRKAVWGQAAWPSCTRKVCTWKSCSEFPHERSKTKEKKKPSLSFVKKPSERIKA